MFERMSPFGSSFLYRCSFKTVSNLNYLQLKNLENWLENLRVISAPGFNKYKQNVFLFIYSIHVMLCYLCTLEANKGVVVAVIFRNHRIIGTLIF